MKKDKSKKKLFGMKLRILRVKKGISQEDCCRKTHCSLRTWIRWETGLTSPSTIYKKYIMELLPEIGKI